MQSLSRKSFLNVFKITNQTLREYQLSNLLHANWRESRKLTSNPNKFGPLTNLPDYSFKDGRPVPFGTNQYKRIKDQRQKLETIKRYSDQMDFAVTRYDQILKMKEAEKQQIIDRKLKKKGDKLLTE